MSHRGIASAAAFAIALVSSGSLAETRKDFPCKGCFTQIPTAYERDKPRPLVVALHGDAGDAGRLFRVWQRASERAGVLLASMRCPVDKGCTASSYWKWYLTSEHDPAWLGQQIDAITAAYAVDRERVYLTGYSGGGTYLGAWGPEHAGEIAAIAYVSGGKPWNVPCPACKVPVLFVIGATDPMITPYTEPLRLWFDRCRDHSVTWEVVPGVTHESMIDALAGGQADRILRFFLEHRATCHAKPTSAEVADAGPAPDTSVARSMPVEASPAPTSAPATPPAQPTPGCGCRSEGAAQTRLGLGGALAAALAAVVRLRGRRPKQRPPARSKHG